MRRPVGFALGLALAVGLLALPAPETPQASPSEEPAVRSLLDSIREDLVQLRFEKALAALEALLGRPGMTQDERAEALILRSQVHVAFGDLDAAEAGYREILALRPAYRPDLSLTPEKAMERFERVARETIGRIQLVLDPPDATLRVDGQVRVPEPTGALPVVAGEHTLQADRAGFDPDQRTLSVPANADVPIEIRLVPNARTVVVRTEPEGVEVRVDGRLAGTTERDPGLVGSGPVAELVIENIPLGEHEFELSKECFRTELLRDALTADLLDRSPKIYKTVRLLPARATLTLDGGPAGAEVWLDGKRVGVLPGEPLTSCPGSRTVEIRLDRRRLVSESVELREGDDRRLAVDPRPNLVRVGADSWPSGLAGFAARFNRHDGPVPGDDPDYARLETWRRLDLPLDTDLALAVRPARRLGDRERWYLYSPLLQTVLPIDRAPAVSARPDWLRATWGFAAVDSLVAGAARVISVDPEGPAAAAGIEPGARLVRVAGETIQGVPQVSRGLETAGTDPVVVEGVGVDGTPFQAELRPRIGPYLPPVPDDPGQALVRAAWAAVDGLGEGPAALAARANLARLLGAFGQHDAAARQWRRVSWTSGPGVGEGTRQYYLGLELERSGDESGAVAAYRKAAASTATATDDDGPPVGPAARDRLADLGVGTD